MEPQVRSAGPSGVLVKNRNSSGCLIVRKKGDALPGGVDSSNSRKLYDKKKARIRHSISLSDSGSSEELPIPPSRRVGPETVRACDGLTAFDAGMVEGAEFGRKRDRMALVRCNEDGLIDKNGFVDREIKRNKLDAFHFDEYDRIHVEKMRRRHFDDNGVGFSGGRYMGSVHATRSGTERELDTGSSRPILEKRKNSYYDRASGLYMGNNLDHSRFRMDRDGPQLSLPLLREKFVSNANEYIRIQGKNGVLKVMVNKKKVGGPLELYDHCKPVKSRQCLRSEGTAAKRNVLIHPSYLETTHAEKSGLVVGLDKKKIKSRKMLLSKDSKGDEWDSENSDTSLNRGLKSTEAHKSLKRASSEDEHTPLPEKLPTTRTKEGKGKRGSGTDKQKLREKIREMLLSAGWTIDYRPRRNRDYLDAVYISPGGTAYWSIIKAYDALQRQLAEDDKEVLPRGDASSFALISDEVLCQLTRKSRKKMEKELKKQMDCSESDSEKEPQIKRSAGNKHSTNSFDSDSNEEKLSSFIRQGNKSMNNKMTKNPFSGASSESHKPTHHSNEGSESRSLDVIPTCYMEGKVETMEDALC